MTRARNLVVLMAVTMICVASSSLQAKRSRPAAVISSGSDARVVFDRYCVTCHSDTLKTGGLSLQNVDLINSGASTERLEKVVRKLRLGAMPPVGIPRPDPATYTALATWLETNLDRAAAARPTPGRTETLHRLNRAEYQNAVRDLLGIEGLDMSTMLPVDDASYGFDNMAGVLGISPTHLERYLDAARTISRIAVGDRTLPPDGETHTLPLDLSQDDWFEILPFGTRGGTLIRHYFPVDAEYLIRVHAVPGVGTASTEANHLEVSVDGARVFFAQVEQKVGRDEPSAIVEVRLPIKAGLREVIATFVQTTSGQVEDLLQPYLRPPSYSAYLELERLGGYAGPYVSQVSFQGPFGTTGASDTPSRRRIFVCRPADAAGELPCARRIISTLARRAYRRPVTTADVTTLLEFFTQGRAAGGFDKGIQVAIERLLASPDFLFRIAEDPPNVSPGTAYRLGDLELASRLSFFLWSSLPDEELLAVASRGTLREPAMLERQVRRMLADPRSEALTTNFAGQWLRLRMLKSVYPDAHMFPDFDENLRLAFRRETELFFESIIREDRSVLDLLNANYTFVNERLARHYGIPNVYGSHFRRITVTDERRRGLLGHGSILTATSHSDRTSPVVRGKWILDNLLAAPPLPPPPNVPALEETKVEGTLRQRMEQHRTNAVCATCHKVMDPPGFALENFDAVGRWRDQEAGQPVDALGTMPDGTTFDGVVGLRAALLAKSDVFVTALTEKLVSYALGRGIEYYDAPAVRAITRATAETNYRFSSLILAIVRSAPFQMRQAAPDASPTAATRTARR